MQALQQITAMTMCSAADESSLSTSFMDGGNIQAPCTVGRGDHRVTRNTEFILFLMFSPYRIKNLEKEKTK